MAENLPGGRPPGTPSPPPRGRPPGPVFFFIPGMGETVDEGTVNEWFKQVGDPVTEGEPLLEIGTDKVDTEIPAPATGVLSEIRVQQGETVPVATVIAVIT